MPNGGPSRWDVEAAVKRSALPAPSRLLIHTLLTHVTNGTLTVPAEYAPSLTTLMEETGLSRGAVAEHLNRLETDEWLKRARPTTRQALKKRARTGYQLRLPVQLLDQSSTRTSPGAGREDEEDQVRTSPGDGLVQEQDGTSPGAGHNPMSSPTSSSPTEKKKGGAGGNERRSKIDEEHPRFTDWWAEYPVKKARGAAIRAFNKAAQKTDVRALIAAARLYRDDPQVGRGYGKHPATWLNGECWLDEPTPDMAATGTDGVPGHGPRARVNDTDWSQGGPTL